MIHITKIENDIKNIKTNDNEEEKIIEYKTVIRNNKTYNFTLISNIPSDEGLQSLANQIIKTFG